MATFAISTEVNIDTLSGKTGGDTYNINGGGLTDDQDSRYGLNNDTSSIMGSVTLSATLGGYYIKDGRKIRLIPFDGGSGNVPAYNTVISGAAGSGKLIGVYDNLTSAPVTPGSAMPADGYIKIKQWNDGAFVDNEALSGLTANVTTDPIFGGTDRVGWLEHVQQESTNFTLSRRNNPTQPVVDGDWLLIGITDGNRATTYQIPTNGVNQYHGGVHVEGADAVSITDITYDADYKTFEVEATAHGLESGDKVVISGVTPSDYNGTYYCKKIDNNTVRIFYDSYEEDGDPAVYVSGGTIAGDWEWYPASPDNMTSANFETSALKGKWCKIGIDGLVRFGHDGTNSSGGYCPPAGRTIRMGNVFFTGATAAARTQNSYNSAVASRPRFITSGAARLVCKYASFNWGMNSLTTPAVLEFYNCGLVGNANIASPANAPLFDNCCLGRPQSETVIAAAYSNANAGIIARDTVFGIGGQGSTANQYPISLADSFDVELTRCKFLFSAARGATTHHSMQLTRVDGINVRQCIIGASVNVTSAANADIKGGWWFGDTNGKNITTFAVYSFAFGSLPSNFDVEGMFIDNGDLPRSGFLNVGSSTTEITVKNIGRRDEIISTGQYSEMDASVSRSGTVATVNTAAPHGYATGDTITVELSENTAAVARAEYTITVTGASQFTFTCTNSGATSFKISFATYQMARLYLSANSTVIKFQNVHFSGFRTAHYGTENTSSDITIENCSTGYRDDSATTLTNNNMHFRGSSMSALNNTAGSSVYGTHMVSGYLVPESVAGQNGVNWTRSAAVVSVNAPNHGLYTAMRIMIQASTDWDAVIPSSGIQMISVTVIDKDNFQFTGTNTAGVSGTLDYIVPDGQIMICCNEPNAASADQFSIIAGTPGFTGAGTLVMENVGDIVEWVTETWITDFDSIPNAMPLFLGGVTQSNYKLSYSINLGSGYSAFKNYSLFKSGSGGSAASTTITMTDTTGIAVGDFVYGEGVGKNAKVVSVDSSTNITVDVANAANIANTGLYFNHAPNETLPADGFKMKIRCETLIANTQAIPFIRFPFQSDANSRDTLYPQITLPTQTVTVSNGVAGTRLQVYDLTADEELYNDTPTFPFTWTDDEEYVDDREIRIRASYQDGADAKEFIEAVIGTATIDEPDLTYRLNQVDDEVYIANAVDGSTVTDVEINDGTMRINIDTGAISWAELYAYEVYWLFTEEGIRDVGQSVQAVDQANYRVSNMLVKNITSPEVPLELTGGWGVDADTGKSIDLVDNTGGSIFNSPDHIVAFTGTAALTDNDLTNIEDIVEGVVYSSK